MVGSVGNALINFPARHKGGLGTSSPGVGNGLSNFSPSSGRSTKPSSSYPPCPRATTWPQKKLGGGRLVVALVVLLSLVGCRTHPQVALLELENRLLEDRIYQLEAQLSKQAQQLAACQQQMGLPVPAPSESGRLRKASAQEGARSLPAPGPASSPPAFSSEGLGPGPSNGGLPTPNLQMPKEALPPGQLPTRLGVPSGLPTLPSPPARGSEIPGPTLNTPPNVQPPDAAKSGNAREPPGPGTATGFATSDVASVGNISSRAINQLVVPFAPPSGEIPEHQTHLAYPKKWSIGPLSSRAQQIRILPSLTGGYNWDGQPGDEGITLAVHPVDEQGQTVPAAAPISIVIIDPAIGDESARVARWDFSAEQIADWSQQLPEGQPLRIPLFWPKQPPQHNRLHVFVRYITADGRKLQADMPILVDVEGRQISIPWAGHRFGDLQAYQAVGSTPATSVTEPTREAPLQSLAGSSRPPDLLPPLSQQGNDGSLTAKLASEANAGIGAGIASDAARAASLGRRPRIPWQPTRGSPATSTSKP